MKVSARLETDFQGSFTLTDFANLKFPPKLRGNTRIQIQKLSNLKISKMKVNKQV